MKRPLEDLTCDVLEMQEGTQVDESPCGVAKLAIAQLQRGKNSLSVVLTTLLGSVLQKLGAVLAIQREIVMQTA
jgi:hypothetical protein